MVRNPALRAERARPPAVPPVDDQPAIDWRALVMADRSCCCPARPAMVALLPPTGARPHVVDLLLCGHHARVCERALVAAGAITFELL